MVGKALAGELCCKVFDWGKSHDHIVLVGSIIPLLKKRFGSNVRFDVEI
jgi:hypothetical protein